MADASVPTRPRRAPALLSAIGGALMVVSFFLPDYVGTRSWPDRSPALLTLWDSLLRAGNLAQSQASGNSQPHVFLAVLFGIPLVMGVVIAVLGVLVLLRASGDLLRGFGVAAVTFALASSVVPLLAGTFAFGFTTGQVLPDESLIGLGACTLVLGLFLVTSGAFAQPRRAA